MQSVFVILTKLIASKNYFCQEFFCNNFGRDGNLCACNHVSYAKTLLTVLLLMGCFLGEFEEGNSPVRQSAIKVGKRPIEEGKCPIKANWLFSGNPPWGNGPSKKVH